MNYIKLILGKDISSIIGKYLLPSKKLIESNRKLNFLSLEYNTELIPYYLDECKNFKFKGLKRMEYVSGICGKDLNYGNKYFWTIR
jgi:hypothetical protein